jgi:glycosyltransferase involved in cell wall biosynthesis
MEQIRFKAPIYSAQEQLEFPLKVPKCDLFWSPHYNVPVLPIRAKKRVVTIHDACHLALGTFSEKIYARWIMKKALYGADQAITVSEFSKQQIQKYVGQKEIQAIHIGVDRDRFVRQSISSALRRKYQLPPKFILYVGNFKPHKNVEGLLHAFARVKLPGLGLVLVGNGTKIGVVPDEELPIFYSMAEMLVFPSFYEGFGLPPLEAMSCGCPTVVSSAASLPEVCGDASLYFHPKNSEEMVDAIRRVATDLELRRALIRKGYERRERFHWEKTAQKHLEIFEKVCFA